MPIVAGAAARRGQGTNRVSQHQIFTYLISALVSGMPHAVLAVNGCNTGAVLQRRKDRVVQMNEILSGGALDCCSDQA